MSATAVRIPAERTRSGEIGRFLALTYTLAVTEWKLRFFGSVLGYLWTLVRPLMFFGVLYVVFTEVAKVGNKVPHYTAVLLVGIVLYQFFAEATSLSVTSLVDRESLLRKARFPRMVVPLAVCLTSLFNLLANFVAVLAFVFASGLSPRWSWLEVPVLIALLLALSVGIGLLLSVAYVRARDVRPIWEVVSQMLFYGSPIFYTLDLYGSFKSVMVCTPIAAILTQMRYALIDPTAPTVGDVAGGWYYALIPIGVILVLLGLGIWVFRRASPNLAENL